jgi:hypothetical protein
MGVVLCTVLSTFVMAQGTSQAAKNARMLTNEFLEYELRGYIQQRNNWTYHIFDSVNCTVYRAAISTLTDNVRTFMIKLSHWERRCGDANDTRPKCIQPETVPLPLSDNLA